MIGQEIRNKVRDALIEASTTYSKEHIDVLNRYLQREDNPQAQWVLEQILKNAEIARQQRIPLCDDTGIPHLLLEMGKSKSLSGEMLQNIEEGVRIGLRELPGRPMAVIGNDIERLEQIKGLDIDSGALATAPIFIKLVDEDVLRLHILMQGGGPEIRSKTFRVFHQHKLSAILDEISLWAKESASLLGCTPCAPAIGIGRTHYEATTLMLQAMAYSNFNIQTEIEQDMTNRLNKSNVGALGLTGKTTALATFMRIGPQRASGVRIVCMRLCCLVEPRVASVDLAI